MKVPLIIFILTCTVLSAQIRKSSLPLQVEWKKDLSIAETEISGLVIYYEQLLVSETGGTSIINFFDINGNSTLKVPVQNTRIRRLFTYKEALYSTGDQHLTRRAPNGNIESEHMLIWKEGAYISTLNGAILRDKFYTYTFGDFLKYSLAGKQIFRKEIAQVCSNQKVESGSHYLFLYGIIGNPGLGSRLMQYDTLGKQRWTVDPGFVTNILADPADNCYVLSGKAQSHAVINKYNKEGKVVWSREVPGQYILNATLHGDSLFLCGGVSMDKSENGAQPAAFSILSATSGEILFEQKFDFFHEDYWLEQFTYVATDGKDVYLAGKTDGQNKKNFLVKLSREGNTTGLKDAEPTKSFNIFPNPGGSKFTINGEAEVNTLQVTVRNIAGKVVYDNKINCNADKSFTLDMGKHAAGNYTVEIGDGKDKVVKKIIVE